MTLITSQHPTETIAYEVDVLNDTIITASWSATPIGPTFSGVVTTSTKSTALLSSLTAGTVYTVHCLLTCASGQIFDQQATVRCA